MKAERALAMMQARAEAASSKAVALSLLAADYAGKISAARQQCSGDELSARLTALMAEQRAAERALSAKLAGEAKERRGDLAKAYHARRRDDRVKAGFRPAAAEVGDRQKLQERPPRRPAASSEESGDFGIEDQMPKGPQFD